MDDFSTIEIAASDWRCSIAPELGGAITRLRWRQSDIFRPAETLSSLAADPRAAACYFCIPWFGRLSGELDRADSRYAIALTCPVAEPDYPLHGHGWVTPWNVAEIAPAAAELSFKHRPSPNKFPWAFTGGLRFRASSEAFEIELSIRNSDNDPMPFGLGIHPFFPRTADTRLKLNAKRCWRPPDGPLTTTPPELTFDEERPLPQRSVDETLCACAPIATITQRSCEITVSSMAVHKHLFAPADDEYFCLEPITQLPGKFGADRLAPGERQSIRMRVAVTAR
ncbi:MAG: hypothetical protein AAGB02_07830 [Pseudomonadota bacterium]